LIAAYAAAVAIKPEPKDTRMLVASGGEIVRVNREGVRKRLLGDALDAAYSPDGTFIAFARRGDLWLANSDGSGQRRLVATPNVEEWAPSWLPDGKSLVYTARVEGRRTIRIFKLPTGPSKRIAGSNGQESGAAASATGRLAFVSTRDGTPIVYTSEADGSGAAAFNATPPTTPFVDVHDLAWSPDSTKLAYDADLQDGTAPLFVDDGTSQFALPIGTRPVWSPGGTRIAFVDETGSLASVAADGTDLRALGAGVPLDWRRVPVGTPKFPNLVQRPPSGLVVSQSRRHWQLGFTSMVDNRGPGILWIRGTRAPKAHVMDVRQLVQLSSGGTRVDPEAGELRYVVAPPHYHWHMLGFDHYELRSVGDYKLMVRDHKSGFCMADHYGLAIGVRHGSPRFLHNCEQFNPKARRVEEGSSVGYTDRYPAFFHGQSLDITKVKAGRYWLVHRANPDFYLRETRYDDNTASLLVRLTWDDGTPRVQPLRSCVRERCAG
jgi:hypothetical protein